MDMTKGFSPVLESVLVLVLFVLAACGGSGGGIATPAPRVDRIHVESQHVDYDIASTAEGTEIRSVLQFSAADAWQAVPRVYADLSVPVESLDPAHRLLSGVASARRVFASRPLSRLVDCGSTLMGPNADSYNVRLRLQIQVDSTGPAESRVRTLVTSTASSDGGITVRCSSTGQLERTLIDRLRALLIQQRK
jgi:hypothetical protein